MGENLGVIDKVRAVEAAAMEDWWNGEPEKVVEMVESGAGAGGSGGGSGG